MLLFYKTFVKVSSTNKFHLQTEKLNKEKYLSFMKSVSFNNIHFREILKVYSKTKSYVLTTEEDSIYIQFQTIHGASKLESYNNQKPLIALKLCSFSQNITVCLLNQMNLDFGMEKNLKEKLNFNFCELKNKHFKTFQCYLIALQIIRKDHVIRRRFRHYCLLCYACH